jgi:hypothetical protein
VPFGIDLDGRHLVLAAALQGVVERHRVEASGGRSRGGERHDVAVRIMQLSPW